MILWPNKAIVYVAGVRYNDRVSGEWSPAETKGHEMSAVIRSGALNRCDFRAEAAPLRSVAPSRPVSGLLNRTVHSATPPTPAIPSIPTPGTAAYWRAQREAVTLFRSFRELLDDPELLLPVLHEIAAHGSARRMLAAHGHDVDRILRSCKTYVASWEEAGGYDGTPEGDRDEPPPGDDWCPRGCQPLYGLGECGMCGYQGRGVWDDAVSLGIARAMPDVAEYCCHCNARTRQTLDGTCQVCGKHAEGGNKTQPGEISFTSDGMYVCVEFSVLNGSAGVTVFAAPADEDAAPGMGVLHFAPPPEHARAIGRALLALADAAERGKEAG